MEDGPVNKGLSFKERYLSALIALADTSRGTLWLVKEPVWIRNIKHYVDSGRKGHLGLSIRNRPCQTIVDMLPLLIGTSKRKGSQSESFAVSNCFDDQSKKTTFFRLRPYQIPFSDAYDNEVGAMIKPNPHKRRLTASELAELNRFLSSKGPAQ